MKAPSEQENHESGGSSNETNNLDEARKSSNHKKLDPNTPIQVTSDEVNFLVYRYLQEGGFVHTAYTFGNESLLSRADIERYGDDIPPGALVSFLQKGLQYVGIEESMDARASGEPNEAFSLLAPKTDRSVDTISMPRKRIKTDVYEASPRTSPTPSLNESVQPPMSSNIPIPKLQPQSDQFVPLIKNGNGTNGSQSTNNFSAGQAAAAAAAFAIQQSSTIQSSSIAQEKSAQVSNNSNNQDSSRMDIDESALTTEDHTLLTSESATTDVVAKAVSIQQPQHLQNGDHNTEHRSLGQNGKPSTSQGVSAASASSVNEATASMPLPEDEATNAPATEVLELKQHTSEVFMCAWNPIFTNLIATGSGDATARIWDIAGPVAASGLRSSTLLKHGDPGVSNKDVTTLEWSRNGELLATGSYDGVARVWRRTGELLHMLTSHCGPIFSLKWNKSATFLLSGSYDKSTIVWDVNEEKGLVKQTFNFHSAPALDVDWKNDEVFASCSTDKTVHVCQVGRDAPVKTFMGHTNEVNAVKWDPSGKLLASCSDDSTAKVWDVESDSSEPLHNFASHAQEIYTLKWSPTGPGSRNPNKPLMLATASFDATVRLWNVQTGECMRVLQRHKESVYSVAFSPSGDYLASGSLAGQLYIWRVSDGKHIKSFKGAGDIFEVAWNAEESRVAACFSTTRVCLIDFKSAISSS